MLVPFKIIGFGVVWRDYGPLARAWRIFTPRHLAHQGCVGFCPLYRERSRTHMISSRPFAVESVLWSYLACIHDARTRPPAHANVDHTAPAASALCGVFITLSEFTSQHVTTCCPFVVECVIGSCPGCVHDTRTRTPVCPVIPPRFVKTWRTM